MLKKAIKSVINQTYTDFNFFILDNASTDNTLVLINNKANINGFDELERILDKIDNKASRICDFNTKAVYVNSFATSKIKLIVFLKIAQELNLWIDNNIELEDK